MFPKTILIFWNVKITKILVLNKWQMTVDSYSRAERKWQTEKDRCLRQITSVRGKMAKGSCWRTDVYKRIIEYRTTVVEGKFMNEKWWSSHSSLFIGRAEMVKNSCWRKDKFWRTYGKRQLVEVNLQKAVGGQMM